MVERQLPKLDVAGSNPVARSPKSKIHNANGHPQRVAVVVHGCKVGEWWANAFQAIRVSAGASAMIVSMRRAAWSRRAGDTWE